MVEFLEWDSKFFDVRVGKAKVSSQEEFNNLLAFQCDLKNEYDLIYIFSQCGLSTSQENVILVDKKVIYTKGLKSNEVVPEVNIVDYQSGEVSFDLLKLALESGVYSRFNLDKNLPKQTYERLYTCWIEQSVKRKIASEVFCYMIDDIPRGLLTLRRENSVGVIGLVATDVEFRGRGIGSVLLRFTKNYCFEKGINELSVATQSRNIPACRLYEKEGFSVSSFTDIWHWWL